MRSFETLKHQELDQLNTRQNQLEAILEDIKTQKDSIIQDLNHHAIELEQEKNDLDSKYTLVGNN